MKVWVVLLLIGCMQSAFGQDDQILELCQGIQRYREEATENPRQVLWRSLRLRFFPSLYSKPLTEKLKTHRPLKAPKNVGDKNMVFFVGLPAPLQASAAAFKADYKSIQQELIETTKKFRFLAKTQSVSECVSQAQSHAVDFEHLKTLNDKIQSAEFQNVQRFKETEVFRRELDQIQGQLSNDWHVKVVTHIGDLHEALRSPEIANAVIVTHGKISGHLIDSFDNQYPNGFFSDLSPSLYSLSFFNCYGAATLSTYDLRNRLATAPSFYRERLVTVADAPSTAQADQVAPIRGFDSFMRRLDQQLKPRLRRLVKKPTEFSPLERCEIQTQASYSAGSPALSLNGTFLGLLNAQGPTTLSYPCEIEKRQGNLLQLTNISSLNWDLDVAPEVNGYTAQAFWTNFGTLRSVLYRTSHL